MLTLVHVVLGPDIRFDHCGPLSRRPDTPETGRHSHKYADDQPQLGLIRIFFYVNGFSSDDGALKVIPDSHHYRDSMISGNTDQQLCAGWMNNKKHPLTGDFLEMEVLEAPMGTVIPLWTHAAHAVDARKIDSSIRWAIVYSYRNPGEESSARYITEEFEQNPFLDTPPLLSLRIPTNYNDGFSPAIGANCCVIMFQLDEMAKKLKV